MKIFSKKEVLPIFLMVLTFIFSVYAYPSLPNYIPIHWNALGEVDGYGGRDFAVLFFPVLIIGIYALMLFIPLFDPLKKNYPSFSLPYFWLRTLITVVLLLFYFYTLLAGLGYNIKINYFILPVFSAMFIIIGFLLPKIKKNYFVGIKTPWTIHSEENWDKTHEFSGKLFIIAGLVSLLGIFIIKYAFLIFIVSSLTAVLASTVYSYILFRKAGK